LSRWISQSDCEGEVNPDIFFRVEPDDYGVAHIRNVIGANEYAENIDNNAFTNAMAKLALEYAARAAETLGMVPVPTWRLTASKIPIERFEDGTTRENATYKRGELIKQADVNLLSFPLGFISDEKQIEKDLAYYEQVMDKRGPAMGFSLLAAIKARLGRPDEAYKQLIGAYRPNFVPPFQVISETAGGTNPYFATGAGGVLQAIIGGFAGLELTDSGIIENGAQLPKHWKSLTIKGVGPMQKTYYYKQP
jgi:trehalose/maltose hydrolase-like predicted phosphorylase